jgi:hypothetical protein
VSASRRARETTYRPTLLAIAAESLDIPLDVLRRFAALAQDASGQIYLANAEPLQAADGVGVERAQRSARSDPRRQWLAPETETPGQSQRDKAESEHDPRQHIRCVRRGWGVYVGV